MAQLQHPITYSCTRAIIDFICWVWRTTFSPGGSGLSKITALVSAIKVKAIDFASRYYFAFVWSGLHARVVRFDALLRTLVKGCATPHFYQPAAELRLKPLLLVSFCFCQNDIFCLAWLPLKCFTLGFSFTPAYFYPFIYENFLQHGRGITLRLFPSLLLRFSFKNLKHFILSLKLLALLFMALRIWQDYFPSPTIGLTD